MTRFAWLQGWSPAKLLIWGVGIGVFLSLIVALGSSVVVKATGTDTFCVSCHYMHPFRDAWLASPHGGQNPQGVVANCLGCHLPHKSYVGYLLAKAKTGASHIYHHLLSDPYTWDWAGRAETRREKFTYESGCRSCHVELTPPGMPRGGFRAHRAVMLGETSKTCTQCHPHVGHKNMLDMVDRYFGEKNEL